MNTYPGARMPLFAVESLESRRLLADPVGLLAAQVGADVTAIKSSIAVLAKQSTQDQRLIAAALHNTGKTNAGLLKTLASDYKAAIGNLHTMQKLAIAIGVKDTKHAAAATKAAIKQNLSTKSVAKMNAALATLSTDDNEFVSTSVVSAFYTTTGAPGNELITIASNNTTNLALNSKLTSIQADQAELTNTPYSHFNTLVTDVSAFATYVINHVSGAVF
jgi:hypothetical protein